MARFPPTGSSRVVIMTIIIAVAVIFAAVFFKMRYRPDGKSAATMFGVCVFAGVVMLLSVGTLSSAGILFYVAELVICSLVVLLYRREGRCQAAVRARKAAAAKRAAQERAMAQAQRKALSCYAAFTEVCGEAA